MVLFPAELICTLVVPAAELEELRLKVQVQMKMM